MPHTNSIILLAILICAGCQVYAPPTRVTHGSAPAKLSEGEVNVESSAAQLYYPDFPAVNGQGSYALSDHVVLEGGVGGQVNQSALAFGGARFIPWPISKQTRPVKLTTDLELGGGLGIGGRLEEPEDYDTDDELPPFRETHGDNREWWNRAAGGVYAGAGVGFNIKWFDLFLRGRFQLATARNIPTTTFLSSMLGFQFTSKNSFKFYIGTGPAMYLNTLEGNGWFFGELGFSKTFSM